MNSQVRVFDTSATDIDKNIKYSSQPARAGSILCNHTVARWDNHQVFGGWREKGLIVGQKACTQEDPCKDCENWGPRRWKTVQENKLFIQGPFCVGTFSWGKNPPKVARSLQQFLWCPIFIRKNAPSMTNRYSPKKCVVSRWIIPAVTPASK